MLEHELSADDREFRRAFEACEVRAPDFRHRTHVRLAYIYLCERSVDQAHGLMKRSLLRFLSHLGIGESKYHETVTRAWLLVVQHFMELSSVRCLSAEDFIVRHPDLLDTKTMVTHYSREVLSSPTARTTFIEPDVAPIPSVASEGTRR